MKITYKRKANGQYDGSKSDKERHYRIVMATIMGLAILTGTIKSAYDSFKPVPAKAETVQEAAAEDPGNLCGLDSVVCPGEQYPKPFTATAYSASPDETDDTPCIAADGSDICKRNRAHETICASNDFALGAKLHIEAPGIDIHCTNADRMNKRYTGKSYVDVFHGHDKKGAIAFGQKPVTVTQE